MPTSTTVTMGSADRMGVSIGADNLTSTLAGQMVAAGVQWVRLEARWSSVEVTQGSYDWTQADHINTATAAGLKVLGLLAYTPTWARDPACSAQGGTCQPTAASLDAFAAFAAAAASRYTQVHHWEVWNEANGIEFWKPAPDPARYVSLLQKASNAVKGVDPTARIITNGTIAANTASPNYYAPPDWVQALYANGAGGLSPVTGLAYFDAVGAHPYCYFNTFDCPSTFADWSSWQRMAFTSSNPPDHSAANMRAVMEAAGEGHKPIWATEFGMPTGGGGDAVTEAHQATMVTDAYALWKSYSWTRAPWGNAPLFLYRWDDLAGATTYEDFFGIVRTDGSVKPAWSTYRSAASQ